MCCLYRNRVNNMKLQVKLLISLAVCAVPIWASSSSSSNNSKLETKAKKEREGFRPSSFSSSSSSSAAPAAVVEDESSTQPMHEMFRDKTGQDEWVPYAFAFGSKDELKTVLDAGANVNFASRAKDDGNAYTALSHIRIWSPEDAEARLAVLIAFKPDPFIRKPDGTIVDFAFTQLCGTRAVKALAMLKEYSLKFCKDNKLEHECKELIEKHYNKHPSKK